MKVKLDADRYIEQYVLVGQNPECNVEVIEPEDFDIWHFNAYRVFDGACVLDKDKLKKLHIEAQKNEIRYRREKKCFPIINRGQFWYDTLTESQKMEIREWYQAWLDAPQTGIEPEDLDFI